MDVQTLALLMSGINTLLIPAVYSIVRYLLRTELRLQRIEDRTGIAQGAPR